MRELVALSALPAVWASYRPLQVAEGLADVLVSTLRLELIYLVCNYRLAYFMPQIRAFIQTSLYLY